MTSAALGGYLASHFAVPGVKVLEVQPLAMAFPGLQPEWPYPAFDFPAEAGTPVSIRKETVFTVILTSAGAEKAKVVKAVREVTGLGVKEARELVEGAPKTGRKTQPARRLREIKVKLTAVGASVEVR